MLSLSLVIAAGVTSPYWDQRPLTMYPGEIKEIEYGLQNMVGDEDLTFKAEIISGKEFANIIDEKNIYIVPAGTKDIKVKVRIIVPQSKLIGEKYDIGLGVTQVQSEQEAGQFRLGSAFETHFDLMITEKPKPAPSQPVTEKETKTTDITWIFIGAIILIIIVIIIIIKRKRKNS